jgi:iron complex outermembrane recepter protein
MQQHNRFYVSIVSLLSVPLTLGALSILSSTASAAEDDESLLDEIVVTARYREERLQQTPIAITAITSEELQQRSFTNAYEVGYVTPNASLRPAQAAFGNTMSAYIRGIGQYDFDFAFEPGVGIYVDDIYNPFTLGSQIDLLDLDHVEVLRGPQGTLFGRGSIGGAIRYVTADPKGDNTGSISATWGDYDRVDLRASYDFSLVEDKLFARIAGVSKSRDGYQDVIDFACAYPSLAGNLNPQSPNPGKGCKVGTQGGEDVTGIRAALRWLPSEDFEVTLTGEYIDDASEARADTLTAVAPAAVQQYQDNYLAPVLNIQYDERFLPPNPFVTYATFSDPRSGLSFKPETAFEKTTMSGDFEWDISPTLNAKLVLAHTEIDSRFATDADGSPLNMQNVDGVQDINYDTVELRFSGRMFDRLDWTLGGFYYDGTAVTDQTVSIPWLSMLLDQFLPNSIGPCILCGTLTFPEAAALLDSDPTTYTFVQAHNEHEANNRSLYAHFVYDLSDRLALSVGGRYSKDEKVVAFDNKRVVNPRVVVDDSHMDWRVGLDFKLSDDVMYYGSASSGYRPGAYNSRPFQATQVVAVDQEEAISYDIGVKADMFDRTLRVNLALFYVDWKTRILPVGGTECPLLDLGPPPVYATVDPSTPGAVQDSLGQWCNPPTVSRTFYANAPADIKGAEVEMVWHPTDALMLTGIVGLLNWKSPDLDNCDFNLDGVPDAGVTCFSDLPPFVPDQNWSFGASYRFDLANGSAITPRVDIYGQSEICQGPTFQVSCADGYQLINGSLLWASADNDWLVTLGITNMSDEEYYLNSFDLTGFGQPTSEKQPGRPQEWFVKFQRNFQ